MHMYALLDLLIEEEKKRIEGNLSKYVDALLRSADQRELTLTVTREGMATHESLQRILVDLCKVGLVTIDAHYTDRNTQLCAHAIPQGL
jgi:hypothetical protein